MIRVYQRALLLSGTILLCASCGAGRYKDLEVEVRAMKQQLDVIRNQQAEHTSELSELQERLRRVSGQVDSPYGENIPQSGERLSLPSSHGISGMPAQLLYEDKELLQQMPRSAALYFEKALELIPQARYSEALKNLEQTERMLRSQVGKPEVLYWKAVIYDLRGDSRNALASYNEIISRYPSAERTANVLFRLALLFKKLGDMPTAKLTFEKLLQDFPGTREAKTARQELQTL